MIGTFCVDGALGEPLAGTAPHRPVWALVEHPGPWGREAVLDAPWPDTAGTSFGAALQARLDAAGVRAVLARRPGAGERGAPDAPSVVLARYGAGGWVASTRLAATSDLLDLDWTSLAASPAPPAGWTDPGPLWGVCTHGTRDACCARLGRPLAAAFETAVPGGVREISHSGGHRFSGVAFDLSRGLLHGRVAPHDVPALVAAQAEGTVVTRLLRGAVHRSPAWQAAESALRDHLGEVRLDALRPLAERGATTADGPRVTTTWRRTAPDGATDDWQVLVVERPLAPRPASCGKPAEPASGWAAVSVDPLP